MEYHTSSFVIVVIFISCVASQDDSQGERHWTQCNKTCNKGDRWETGNHSMAWHLECNSFPCKLEPGQPKKPACVLFVVDTSAGVGEENDWKRKQGVIDILTGLNDEVDDLDKHNISFAMISFDHGARVDFDFWEGYTLANLDALTQTIWNMAYNPNVMAGVDLPDALIKADELLMEANPEYNQHVYVISLHDADKNLDRLEEGIREVNDYLRTVYAIGIGRGWSDEQMLDVVNGYKNKTFRVALNHTEVRHRPKRSTSALTVLSWGDIYSDIVVTIILPVNYVTCVNNFESACDYSCGPGKFTIIKTCIGYRDDGLFLFSFRYIMKVACCKKPCCYRNCDNAGSNNNGTVRLCSEFPKGGP